MHLVKHHRHLKSPWPLNSSNICQKSKLSSENQSKFGVVLWKITEQVTSNAQWHTVKMPPKNKAHQCNPVLCPALRAAGGSGVENTDPSDSYTWTTEPD
ncbi:hypothetical protein ACRRTK_012638 [Alexandromys fortis]